MNPHRRCCNKYVGILNPRQSAVKATSRAPTPDKTNVYFIACFTCKRRGARDRKAGRATKAPRRKTPTGRRLCGGPAASMGERSTSCPAGFCCARGWQPSNGCRASSLRPHLGHKSSKKAPTAEAMGAVACLWAYRTIIARHRPNTTPMSPQQRASTRTSPP